MADKLTTIKQLEACAAAAKNFTNDLVGEIAEATASAIEEIDTLKADKSAAVAFTIPNASSSWVTDTSVADYPYYYEIPVLGVTANDYASIMIAPDSQTAAIACGLCPTNETLADKIKIRSKSIPAKAISAEYRIEQGKEN